MEPSTKPFVCNSTGSAGDTMSASSKDSPAMAVPSSSQPEQPVPEHTPEEPAQVLVDVNSSVSSITSFKGKQVQAVAGSRLEVIESQSTLEDSPFIPQAQGQQSLQHLALQLILTVIL